MSKIQKNKAWFLGEDGRFPRTIYVMYDHDNNLADEIDFKLGKRLDPTEVGTVNFYVENTKKATKENILAWPFLPNSTGLPLLNKEALELFEREASGEFQSFPVHLNMQADGSVIKGYNIINILNRLPMLNHEESILKEGKENESWDRYEWHYYNRDTLDGKNLARDDYRCIFFGSEKLRKAVKESELKGMQFKTARGDCNFLEDKQKHKL